MSEEGYWWEEILRTENSRCKGPGAGVILISWCGGVVTLFYIMDALTVYDSVVFSIFRVVISSPRSTLKYFCHPEKKPCALWLSPRPPALPHLQASVRALSVSVDLPSLGISCK